MPSILLERKPVSVNYVVPSDQRELVIPFHTSSSAKLHEISEILNRPVEGLPLELHVDEIQPDDPRDLRKVIQAKAVSAWFAAGRNPVIVEDTSFEVSAIGGKPGVFVKQFAQTPEDKMLICREAKAKKDNKAKATTIFAVFDGNDVHMREGSVTGRISGKPRGTNGFGWDDIFEPDLQSTLSGYSGKRRTYAEMSPEEKNRISMRTLALQNLRDNPFILKRWIFQLPEPPRWQMNHVLTERLSETDIAVRFAYNLSMLGGQERRSDFTVDAGHFPPYHELDLGDDIRRYVSSPGSPDLGIIITPVDTAVDFNHQPHRLVLDGTVRPIFWQIGPEATRMALAARAQEFRLFHNEKIYGLLRAMKRGEIKTPPRTNHRSPVLEDLLKIMRGEEELQTIIEDEDPQDHMPVLGTIATSQLGYARRSTDRTDTSRKAAANEGLFVTTSGLPSSLFGLGGMPPVTGWTDVLSTAAMSYMDAYVPHNSIYVKPDLQTKLYRSARDSVKSIGIPKDIEEIVLGHIGISVGSENPEQIAQQVAQWYQNDGLKLVRIYTTNPNANVVETARLIRMYTGKDMRICVGPITDLNQAKKLIDPLIKTNILLAGHGGGENCTSLAGGGAATGLELAYLMSLDPDFNETSIGLEGGTGESIGGLLGMIDLISVDRRGVGGGIECGGLYVQHKNGIIVQPYHGSASVVTQRIEAAMDPLIAARRLDFAGRLNNVEGKPGYLKKSQSTNSIVDPFFELRRLAGTALADLGCLSLAELRNQIENEKGYSWHRIVTPQALAIAQEHRNI